MAGQFDSSPGTASSPSGRATGNCERGSIRREGDPPSPPDRVPKPSVELRTYAVTNSTLGRWGGTHGPSLARLPPRDNSRVRRFDAVSAAQGGRPGSTGGI